MNTQVWMRAAEHGDSCIVENLLEDADVNVQDTLGHTALMFAAGNGLVASLDLLLDHGADVNLTNRVGTTALMRAASEGHTEVVKRLLEKGADVDARRQDGSTALILAASAGHTDCVRALLDNGADILAAGVHNLTALGWAAAKNHTDTVQFLHDAQAPGFETAGMTPAVEQVAGASEGDEYTPENLGAKSDKLNDAALWRDIKKVDPADSKGRLEALEITSHASTPGEQHIEFDGSEGKNLPGMDTAGLNVMRSSSAERQVTDEVIVGIRQRAFMPPQNRNVDRRRHWWKLSLDKSSRRIAILLTLIMLFVSGVSVYTVIEDIKRDTTDDQGSPLVKDNGISPLPAPTLSSSSVVIERNFQLDTEPGIPIVTPTSANVTRKPDTLAPGEKPPIVRPAPSSKTANGRLTAASIVAGGTTRPNYNEPEQAEEKPTLPTSSKSENESRSASPLIPLPRPSIRDVVPSASIPPPVRAPASNSAPLPKKKVIEWP